MIVLAVEPKPSTYPPGTPISIVCSEPDSEIYFTLDGSPPSPVSKRYRSPILLGSDTTANGTMRLRAISVEPNGRRSPVEAADYGCATGISIRFRKPNTWSSAFIHHWDTEPDGWTTDWPGQPMLPQGNGWYRYLLPDQTSANLVFNDMGGAQTRDFRVDSPDAWFTGEEHWQVDPTKFADFLFPGGVSKALVVSMDDGPDQDRRLIELLNRHGIRGTFHLNSGRLGEAGHVGADEVAALYAGHEVSTHSVTHPYLDSLSKDEISAEVGFDRDVLSRISDSEVRGHAYPFGAHDSTVIEELRKLGIAYARTAGQTGDFRLPSEPLAWVPSCHHRFAGELAETFLDLPGDALALFFIYGHSWELDANEPASDWDYMESLAQRLGGRDDIWYATAIEVADYIQSIASVRPSLAEDRLLNASSLDLWMRDGSSIERLPAGRTSGVFPKQV